MVIAPADTPVTTLPDAVASEISLLLQVPPAGNDAKEILLPTHTAVGPAIDEGNALTVNGVVTAQPVGNV